MPSATHRHTTSRGAFVPVQAFGIDPDALTRNERRLYVALARDPHRVLSKHDLVRALWVKNTREIDAIAEHLRRKLGDRAVTSIPGEGYQLVRDVAEPGARDA